MLNSRPILDTNERKQFSTGAVRDIDSTKGRCDLLPIDILSPLMNTQFKANILHHIGQYMKYGDCTDLYNVLFIFAGLHEWSIPQMILEVSIHYSDGCEKYGERNWEKGIPLHSYIDSATRHFFKYLDNNEDERHDRAFVWNILCAIWTHQHLPEMIDITFQAVDIDVDTE